MMRLDGVPPNFPPGSAFPLLGECACEEITRLVTDHLDVFARLACACTCKALLADWDDRLQCGKLFLSGEAVSDRFLLWLLRRVPVVRSLDVDECDQLSRAGIRRAIQFGNTRSMTELRAHSVGGASWSVDELRELIDACPSLKVLHADCRAKGVGADQLNVFNNGEMAIRPRKLVLHSTLSLTAAQGAGGPAAGPAGPAEEAAHAGAQQLEQAAMNAEVAAAAPAGAGAPQPVEPAPLPAPAAPEAAAHASTALGITLQRCRESLEEVDARSGMLDEESVAELSDLVGATGSTLRRLLIPGSCRFNDDAMQVLAAALKRSERLELLQLGCSSINAAGARTLAGALTANTSLRQLELQHNPLLDAGASALGHALAANTSLRTLAVPFTGLGDGACAALARALREGSTLETLDLAGNRLTAAGVSDLSAALPSASALTSLCLTANAGVGARGAMAIAAVLPQCQLTTLRLDGCNTGPSPCGRLAAALVGSSIAEVDLSSNEIGDLGAWELAWRMPDCAALRDVKLASNEIEDDGAEELLVALTAAAHIRSLDLRGNRLAQKGETARGLSATRRANVAFQRASPCAL